MDVDDQGQAAIPETVAQSWHPEEREHRRKERCFWKAYIILTAVIGLGALASAMFAYFAYNAASRQANVAADSEKHQLRAHILFESAELDLNKRLGSIRFRNSGVTPAFAVTSWWKVDAIDPHDEAKLDFQDTGPISTDIGAGGFLDLDPYPIAQSKIEAVKSGEKMFYVWGVIKYLDVFQRCQYSSFSFRADATVGPKNEWHLRGFRSGSSDVSDFESGDCADKTKINAADKAAYIPHPIFLPGSEHAK